jgi:hypothetical protein
VDFATAASQNGACITQQFCQIMILFHDFAMMKDESDQKSNVFFQFLNTCEGKAFTYKTVLRCSR